MADITVSSDIDTFLQSADNAAAFNNIKQAATETTEGTVELATEAEVLGVSAVDTVVRARHMRVKVETANGNAVSIGDLGGDARGSGSVTIQTSRASATKVASGVSAVAIGYNTTASNTYSLAIGAFATSSAYHTTAVGYNATASGTRSGAFGNQVKSATVNVQELGYWTTPTVRAGAVRVHGTGMVGMTIQNRSTAFGDGGATAGSEADNTLLREGIAFRRNGDVILVDVNIGGTVKTLSLGTAA